jgi:hypothetical protein
VGAETARWGRIFPRRGLSPGLYSENGEMTTMPCLLPLTYGQHIRTLADAPSVGRTSISRFLRPAGSTTVSSLFHSPGICRAHRPGERRISEFRRTASGEV